MTEHTRAAARAASAPAGRLPKPAASGRSPWPALWALVIGFFMILVDTTIVSVANPAIKAALDPDTNNLDNVVWVTRAYLLAYAVPLLITGRLGDRFGPKRIYLIGLVVFTLASLWCGLSGTLEMLIIARAVQGLGAALMTPQTMAVITRTFPPDRRGAAMGLWGATAGVATLVGPLAGGLLVDGFGWEWIFFINVPVGIIAFVMAWMFVPNLPTHAHRFDISASSSARSASSSSSSVCRRASTTTGASSGVRSPSGCVIIAGVIVMGIFIWTQARTKNEPLVPLELFKDRNFAVSNLAIATVGFTVTSMSLPLMFFIQLARGPDPDAVRSPAGPDGAAHRRAGAVRRQAARPHRPALPARARACCSSPDRWSGTRSLMNADTPIWMFLFPSAMMGIGNAGMWGPLATTATRNLPMSQAGAGAGIYNTTRTVGSVIGSAAIAAFMQSRLEANLPGAGDAAGGFGGGTLPDFVVDGFSTAMAQAILLPGRRAARRRRRRALPAPTEGLGRGRVARRERAAGGRSGAGRGAASELTPAEPAPAHSSGSNGSIGAWWSNASTPRRQYPLTCAWAGRQPERAAQVPPHRHESGSPRRPPRRRRRRRSEPSRSRAARTVAARGIRRDDVHADVDAGHRHPGIPPTQSPEPGTAAITSTGGAGRHVAHPAADGRQRRLVADEQEPVDVLRRPPRSARSDDDELVARHERSPPTTRPDPDRDARRSRDRPRSPPSTARGSGVKSREIEARSGRIDAVLARTDGRGRDELAGRGIREEHPDVIGRTAHSSKSANSGPDTVTRTIGGATRWTRSTVRPAGREAVAAALAREAAGVAPARAAWSVGNCASLMLPANHRRLRVRRSVLDDARGDVGAVLTALEVDLARARGRCARGPRRTSCRARRR